MSKLSLAALVKEILGENVGCGPDDLTTVTQVFKDIMNQQLYNPEDETNVDGERGYVLFSDKEKAKTGQLDFSGNEMRADISKFNSWKKKTDLPKGRKVRKVKMFNK